MRLHLILLLALTLCFSFSCSNNSTGTNGGNNNGNGDGNGGNGDPPAEPGTYQVEDAFPSLSFSNPLYIDHAGDGSNRLFVVEQGGTIRVFENDPSTSDATVFLDISGRLTSGGERGLLGLAFHPNYENNGYFYVNYTDDDGANTVISRFEVSAGDPVQADPNSETIILEYDQPFSNHNGGHLSFGPDGYLYIASGDGGSGGDPQNNAQTRENLLGAILRIDVDGSSNGNNYAIPADNPYVGNSEGYREEIYAYGLRNPWRFSFDSQNGDLIAGDVGQNEIEEIDLIENGGNYGWRIMEGTECFNPSSGCDQSGLELPIWEYSHDLGRSITGGFAYRGTELPGLEGWYIYGDFITGLIWALDYSDPDNPENIELVNSDLNISSFGTDADEELYICSFDGNIYKLVEEQ